MYEFWKGRRPERHHIRFGFTDYPGGNAGRHRHIPELGLTAPLINEENKLRSMMLLAPICFSLVAGCKDFPGADGRYATPARGGWDNFRAGAPVHEDGMLAMGP